MDPMNTFVQVYSIGSTQAGQVITVHVEPDAQFRVAFFLQDVGKDLVSCEGRSLPYPGLGALHRVTVEDPTFPYVFKSASQPNDPRRPDSDWGWPSIDFVIPSSWPPNLYFAAAYGVFKSISPGVWLPDPHDRVAVAIMESDDPIYPSPPYGDSMTMFVVKPGRMDPHRDIAYILPTATYQAYNMQGGGCYYPYPGGHGAVKMVTMLRPGDGVGGRICDPPDPYDQDTPRQTFAHWDAIFIRWLRTSGYNVDFYTDFDLDDPDNNPLIGMTRPFYKLMLSAGHHEYWSQYMRNNVSNFLVQGGNVAIFSGNTCYRPVSFDRQKFTITKLADKWDSDNNEINLIGVHFSDGGGRWGVPTSDCDWTTSECGWAYTERPELGYTAQQPNTHWAFAGTDIVIGHVIGSKEHLIGYEFDGRAFDRPVCQVGTEKGVCILASAPIGQTEQGWTGHYDANGEWVEDGGNELHGAKQAVMVVYGKDDNPFSGASSKQGLVFNAGTTDWVRAIDVDRREVDDDVWRITNNVIRVLSMPG